MREKGDKQDKRNIIWKGTSKQEGLSTKREKDDKEEREKKRERRGEEKEGRERNEIERDETKRKPIK